MLTNPLVLTNMKALARLVVGTVLFCSPVVAAASEMMNVLFIAADDLRNDLGCYGHPEAKTPNLDGLAARGVLFERAYCQQALCNPSRASLMTGRRPDSNGIWNLPLHFREVDPTIVTLPEFFKQHGYHTQGIGKLFHNWRQASKGDPQSWTEREAYHYARHDDDKPLSATPLPPNEAESPRCMRLDVPDEAYFDGRIADLAVAALRKRAALKQPFFLGVGFWKPHLPFNAPKKYWNLYQRNKIRMPSSPSAPIDAPKIALHDSREILRAAGKDGLSPAQVRELRHGYLAAVSFLDAQVGKVLNELERLDLNHKTVVVFWSDHGFHLGEQSLWCKNSNFELDARVPLIIAAPDVGPQGATTKSLAELLDIYPTLAELCGLPKPAMTEGVSLTPILKKPSASVKRAAYTQTPRPAYYRDSPEAMGVSVRTDRFRYTQWRDFHTGELKAQELYDHQDDPHESRNVVALAQHKSAVDEASRLLEIKFPRRGYPTTKPATLTPIRYHNPGLKVDLGVGLWAWPMPMDWDNDGDLDLVVSCPDVPYRGIYWFENPGGGDFPIFKPARRVGQGRNNIGLSMVDGQPRILAPGYELTNFKKSSFDEKKKIYPNGNPHGAKVRANQWSYVDFDGDGALDIVVGVGDWGDYGWDNAFDKHGQWQRGPLRGFVYLLRNQGTTSAPDYAKPVKLTAGGATLEVFGMPSPNFADFDGDGDLDLICGEFLDGFNYFENSGSRRLPRLVKPRRLRIKMDLQMIVPSAIDWDGDGDIDLICGDEDGRVAFIEHTGNMKNGAPEFKPPRYFQQQASHVKFGALVTPVSVDWDGDGDEDLICGNTAGYVGFIENLDGGNPPKFAAPKLLQADGRTLRIQAGENGSIQGPAEAKWGYTTLDVADWDHDGRLDLVVNSIWGLIVWYRNVGTKSKPRLEAARDVRVAWPGAPPKPAWNWWNPKPHQLSTQWRTTPLVYDINGDKLNDLVALDQEGFLAFHPRKRHERGELVLQPGQRIFTDEAGKPLRLNAGEAGRSGRRKLCLADWDGDGKVDLLANSTNVELWRNVSTKNQPWAFRNEGNMHELRLAGHTTSPTVVDWNRDGKPELLVGAEDGRLYYMPHRRVGLTERQISGLKIECRDFRISTLDEGTRAYSNREYVWFDVPNEIRGRRLLQTAGGRPQTVFVTSPRPSKLFMATSLNNQTPAKAGWSIVEGLRFGYTDGGRTKMQVWEMQVQAQQRVSIPQGSWTGGILLLPSK